MRKISAVALTGLVIAALAIRVSHATLQNDAGPRRFLAVAEFDAHAAERRIAAVTLHDHDHRHGQTVRLEIDQRAASGIRSHAGPVDGIREQGDSECRCRGGRHSWRGCSGSATFSLHAGRGARKENRRGERTRKDPCTPSGASIDRPTRGHGLQCPASSSKQPLAPNPPCRARSQWMVRRIDCRIRHLRTSEVGKMVALAWSHVRDARHDGLFPTATA